MVLNTAYNNLATTITTTTSTVIENNDPNSNNNNNRNDYLNKKRQSIDNSMIKFPKLDECAHFHYETAELDNFQLSLINTENYSNRLIQQQQNHSNTNGVVNGNVDDDHDVNNYGHHPMTTDIQNLNIFVRIQCSNRSWTVRRDLRDFSFLDTQLHKCVFDREHSQLKKLNIKWFSSSDNTLESILYHIDEYLHRLSMIAGSSLTCGPILHWFEMDNHGNRLINEESDINTPAIGAAFVIKKHCKKDVETEISLDIGELISVIEMPPVSESFYWKGKKGFEVGFFPAECVQLIDDKISRKSEELSLRPLKKCVSPTQQCHRNDLNLSLSDSENDHHDASMDAEAAAAAIRKRSKISALFRNFVAGIRTRRRDQLKRSGILKERVFGCDLCEHLENSGHEFPLVLTACCSYIEANGLNTNGIYRISGVVSTINRLRNIFDEDRIPQELLMRDYNQPSDLNPNQDEPLDIHAVGSLLKLYFRELPNPLLTYSLFDSFIMTMRDENVTEEERCRNIKKLIRRLPPPHWRTLRLLIRHLALVSQFHTQTGMTPKNIAIVWAPNLLRAKTLDLGKEALQIVATQAILTEFLITNCDKIFDQEEYEIHPSKSLYSSFVHSKENYLNNTNGNGNCKSPPLSSKCLKYIDVGPEIIPGKYHTIISCRPASQSKRSKFNLQNFKFHNFFTTARSPIGGTTRHRPSLSAIHNHHHNQLNNNDNQELDINNRRSLKDHGHRYSNQMTNNNRNLLQQQSNAIKYASSFQSKILCCSNNNKQVKRAESFESYFKKMKTNNFFNNNQQQQQRRHHLLGDNNNNNNDHINEDITNKSINLIKDNQTFQMKDPITNLNHCSIHSETIFEVEEKNLNENDENCQPLQPVSTTANTAYDMVEMQSDDDNENNINNRYHRKKIISNNNNKNDNTEIDTYQTRLSPPPISIFDLYPLSSSSSSSTTTAITTNESTALKAIENFRMDEEVIIDSNNHNDDSNNKHKTPPPQKQWEKPTKIIDMDIVSDGNININESRKRIQRQFSPSPPSDENDKDKYRFHSVTLRPPRQYNSAHRLTSTIEDHQHQQQQNTNKNNYRNQRAKLGRSMPVMEFNFTTNVIHNNNINSQQQHDNDLDNIDDTLLIHKINTNITSLTNGSNAKKPILTTKATNSIQTKNNVDNSPTNVSSSSTIITKMTITPLRTVNKRQRIIYDKNELSSFFEK